MTTRNVTAKREARRALTLLASVSALGVLLTTVVVLAQSKGLTTWKNGQTLNATELNENFSYLDNRITSIMTAPPAPAAADSLPVRLFRIVQGDACTLSQASEPAYYADCTCAADEVAISGGGYCGPSNALIENANIAVNGARLNGIWRVQCQNATPANYYALCLKVSR